METFKAKNLCFFSGIFVGMILTILLGGCSRGWLTSNRPSDFDIKKAIEEKVLHDGRGFVKLISFKKTDGIEQEIGGVRYYTAVFEADLECLTGCYYSGTEIAFEIPFSKEKEFFGPQIPCAQGQQVTVKAEVRLIKTERGWHREE